LKKKIHCACQSTNMNMMKMLSYKFIIQPPKVFVSFCELVRVSQFVEHWKLCHKKL